MNRKQVMGLVTVGVIIGGTVYCIKKYKDSVKEGEVIDLATARQLVKERPRQAQEEYRHPNEMSREEMDEMIDEAHDEAGWNASFEQSADIDDYDYYDGLDYTKPLAATLTEEDKQLRFNPDSIQARDQFVKMELAELIPNTPEYQIMKKLFNVEFEPLNDGDEILRSQLADYRQEFFGPTSRWNEAVTIGDIVTNYARLTDYNIGGGIGSWIVAFIHNTEFSELSSDVDFNHIVTRLNQHEYMNNQTDLYGFFGLNSYIMSDAQRIADDTIDGEVTYEIEFNEFLKHVS